VPLSGFLNLSAVSASTKFHGLISCRNRSWTALLQSFPLVEIVYPSRGHWLPCSYRPCCGTHHRRPYHPRFLRTPTLLTQSPKSLANYGFPFHESEGPLSGSPGSPTEGSSLPPASPASKLYSLSESVRTDSSCPEPSGRCSPGFPPL